MEDEHSCPPGMDRCLYTTLRRPLERSVARLRVSLLGNASVKRAVRNRVLLEREKTRLKKNLQAFKVAHLQALAKNVTTTKVLELLQEFAAARSDRKLDVVLSLLSTLASSPSEPSSVSPPSSDSQPPSTVPSASTPSHLCVICQQGVEPTGFLLACCGQRLHEPCACAFLMRSPEESDEESDPKCPSCRRPFSEDMEEAAEAMVHRLWHSSAGQAKRYVLLTDVGRAFHAECTGHMQLATASEGICDHMATSLSLWSPEGDRIHDFVTKNFNGQWPAAGKTWIRLTTADWRNVTMRFEGFRNVFWDQAGPTVRLSFGDVDELEIIELPLDTICHAAPRNPFKLRLDTPYFLGECNLGAAKGCLCLVSLGERTDAYTFEDFVQDAVGPQLRLRTRDGRSILVFAACVADMRSPKWCPDPLRVLDAHGHPLRPARPPGGARGPASPWRRSSRRPLGCAG